MNARELLQKIRTGNFKPTQQQQIRKQYSKQLGEYQRALQRQREIQAAAQRGQMIDSAIDYEKKRFLASP